jgi:hypothetical protein
MRARSIAPALPGSNFGYKALLAVDAPIQALTPQQANLDFYHVQPAGMLGDVVEPSLPARQREAVHHFVTEERSLADVSALTRRSVTRPCQSTWRDGDQCLRARNKEAPR